MENREMPILHKSQALGHQILSVRPENFFFAGTSRQRKNLFSVAWYKHCTPCLTHHDKCAGHLPRTLFSYFISLREASHRLSP